MNNLQFDQAVVDTIKKIEPNIEITQALCNEDCEISFRDEEGLQAFKDRNVKGVEFAISQDSRDRTVDQLQKALGNKFAVYFSKQSFGHEPDEITVLETLDQYDAIRFEGCNGVNYDIYTEDIIKHLQELEKKHPFILTGVGEDFVQGNFLSPLTNIEELAEQMYEFCPDIVDQGTGDLEHLVVELKKSNSFYYWWD